MLCGGEAVLVGEEGLRSGLRWERECAEEGEGAGSWVWDAAAEGEAEAKGSVGVGRAELEAKGSLGGPMGVVG